MPNSLTFISMAARNVIRNRQKTVTSVLGIILAVTLIFGETISLELQSSAVLGYEMEEEDSHVEVSGYTLRENGTQYVRWIHDDLKDVDGSGAYNFRIRSRFPYTSAQPAVYLSDYNMSNESHVDFVGVFGDMVQYDTPEAPELGSIFLPHFMQERDSIVTGQMINLTFAVREHIWNESGSYTTIRLIYFTRSFTVAGFVGGEKFYWDEPYYYFEPYYSQIFLHGDDFLDIMDEMMNHTGQKNISSALSLDFDYYMKFDPSVYEATNIVKARENADDTAYEMREIVDEYQNSGRFTGMDIDTRYEEAFEDTSYYFDDVKWIILALSIPIIIFGLYLGYLGIELFLSERRREIGMLKARGANRGKLMILLLTESLFVGAVAGGLGILLAGYGAKLIMFTTQASSNVDVPWYDPFFSVNSFIAAILLGMLLMFASSINLFKRITKLDAGELLSKYSTKQEKPYNPVRDMKVLAFTAICIVVIGFIDELDSLITTIDNIIFTLVLGLFVFIVVPVMVIVSPYVIIVLGIRLATRGSNRWYAKLAEFAEMLTGELGYLIRRGIATGSRRIMNLTTVLSVLFAFLVLTSTFTFAQQDLEERTVKTEVGGDMQILLRNHITKNETIYLDENLTKLDGIRSSVPLLSSNLDFQLNFDRYVQTYLVNASQYSRLAYFDGDIFTEGDKSAIRSLRDGGIIVSEDAADDTDTDRGDTVIMGREVWVYEGDGYDGFGHRRTIRYGTPEVRAIMNALPGVLGSNMHDHDWILMDEDVFMKMVDDTPPVDGDHPFSLRSRIVLLETTHSADEEMLINVIGDMEMVSIDTVRSSSHEIERLRTEPTAESFLLVLRTQLGVLVFISLLASATIVFISSHETRRERASIMLRGTTRRQLFLLEYGEAMVILVYSLIVGLTTGIIAGVVWIFVFNVFEELDTINRSYWPSFSMIPVILIMIVIFLIAVTISTWKLQKFDLLKFVRWG